MELGLLLLRLVVGLTMAAHGAQKLFGSFGGYGIEGTGGWLESLGFRPGPLHARVVGMSELGGGMLLALGLLTPLGAAAVIGVMIVAIATVHREKGFFNTAGGYEFNILLIAASACLAFAGPGAAALDDAFGLDMAGVSWGFFSLLLGMGGAMITLAMRRTEPAAAAPEEEDRLVVLDDETSQTTEMPAREEHVSR